MGTPNDLERFRETYRVRAAPPWALVEREAVGADWGTNGYTTIGQADALARRLALAPGHRLLDVGAGRGWPGLYLAAATGCDAVITDLPVEPLVMGMERAADEGVATRTAAAAAGTGLPFRPGTFHAVVHADVIC